VLDAGCGTGEHALLAAARGADAVGIDISAVAIERARAKAAQRGLPTRFEVGDLLRMEQPGTPFDTVIDAGAFHVFDDAERVRYVSGLASALRPGGTCYLLCFNEHQPGPRDSRRPRRVRQDELRAAFADGWTVTGITADGFVTRGSGGAGAHAWLAAIRRS
jgi:cyclopropane fatty-acyl-phospholipid synthase-like methyltransferase